MRKLGKKILFYYCALFSILIAVSGVIFNLNSDKFVFQLFFLPVPIFFIILLKSRLKKKGANSEQSSTSFMGLSTVLVIFAVLLSIGAFNIVKTRPVQKSQNEIKQMSKASPTPTKNQPSLTVKTDIENSKVNIREDASKSAKVVVKVENGKTFPILSNKGDWYEIKVGSTSGWINKELVEIQK